MGMLSRYQKSGGFLQLLNLIETCGPQKQTKFLTIIEEEDPRWAATIRQKMLTIPKIFSWENEVLAEVAARLQDITFATALHGLSDEDWDKLSTTLSHSQKRRIEEMRDEKKPTPAEITTALLQIVEEVRNMITHGYLRIEKVDESLVIADDIEEKINSQFADMGVLNFDAASSPTPSAQKAEVKVNPNDSNELKAAKQQLSTFQKENQKLKEEVRTLRSKLDQIKKIA